MLRDCPIDHRCMTAITADEVFARSLALLGRAAVAAGAQNAEGAKVSDASSAPNVSDASSAADGAALKLEAVR